MAACSQESWAAKVTSASLRSTPEGAVGSSMTDSCAVLSFVPIILMGGFLKALLASLAGLGAANSSKRTESTTFAPTK